MPVPAVEFTPIQSRRGGVVHATTLRSPGKTACGKKVHGWRVALAHLDCIDCKARVFFVVKPRGR